MRNTSHSKQRGDHVLAGGEDGGEQIGRADCGFEALSGQELGGFCLRVRGKQRAGCCDGPMLRSPIRHQITTLKWAADVRHNVLPLVYTRDTETKRHTEPEIHASNYTKCLNWFIYFLETEISKRISSSRWCSLKVVWVQEKFGCVRILEA